MGEYLRKEAWATHLKELACGDSVTALQARDAIFFTFCQIHGDTVLAQSIMKKSWRDSGLDWDRPSASELRELSRRFVEILRSSGKEEEAEIAGLYFSRVLCKVGPDG